jgi:hypothetical protein
MGFLYVCPEPVLVKQSFQTKSEQNQRFSPLEVVLRLQPAPNEQSEAGSSVASAAVRATAVQHLCVEQNDAASRRCDGYRGGLRLLRLPSSGYASCRAVAARHEARSAGLF